MEVDEYGEETEKWYHYRQSVCFLRSQADMVENKYRASKKRQELVR